MWFVAAEASSVAAGVVVADEASSNSPGVVCCSSIKASSVSPGVACAVELKMQLRKLVQTQLLLGVYTASNARHTLYVLYVVPLFQTLELLFIHRNVE